MRAVRLVVLVLVMAMLVAGLLLSAGPAAADGPQFRETSGRFSALCTANLEDLRLFPEFSGPYYWNQQVRYNGTMWTQQSDGQLYFVQLIDGRSFYHWSGRPDRMLQVYHAAHTWKLYPVPSYDYEIANATGWYEGHYVEGTVADNWWELPLPLEQGGHLAGQGYGDLAGQTLHLTTVITDWGGYQGLCPDGQVSLLNGIWTMQFGGKP